MENKSDPDRLLQDALTHCDLESVASVLETEDVDPDRKDVNHGLQTPLMRACHIAAPNKQLANIVRLLLDRKPQINAQDASGKTALAHACIAERCSVIKLLIGYPRCDPNVQDGDGNSPLMYACKTGSENILECFVSCCQGHSLQLQVHQPNRRGITCLMEAERKGVKHVIEKLLPEDCERLPGCGQFAFKRPCDITAMTSPRSVSRQSVTSCNSAMSIDTYRGRSPAKSHPRRHNNNNSKNANVNSGSTLNTNGLTRTHLTDFDRRRGAGDAVNRSRDSSVECVRGSGDDVNDSEDENDEEDDEKLAYFRTRYKNSRRGSVSLPDLRNIPGLASAVEHAVPDIVITPTASAEHVNLLESTTKLSINGRRGLLRKQTTPEIACSLPNLVLPPRGYPVKLPDFPALQEDDSSRLSLPDIPRSLYEGKPKFKWME